jgi:WD40 repeat protein
MFHLKDQRVSLEYVAFSPDGGTLAACGLRGPLQLWVLTGRSLAHRVACESIIRTIFFAPDGQGLFVLIDDAGVCLFDTDGGERLVSPVVGEDAYGAAFSADGRQVCLCSTPPSGQQLLQHFHLPGFRPGWTTDVPGDIALVAMAFSLDGGLVAVAKSSGSVHLFDTASGTYRGRCGPVRSGEVRSVALSPDGETVIWCAASRLHVWRIDPPAEVAHHNLGRAHFFCVRIHPSGDFFATANGDGKIDFWDARTGAHRQSFDWGVGKLHAVTFDASGDRAACCGKTGEIVVWDVDR